MTAGNLYAPRVVDYARARVIGGCSSHNGCAAIWGSRVDYDGWAALGNPGWSTDELRPLFEAGSERLRVRIPEPAEITPFQRASLDAAVDAGIPRVADLNNLDENLGMAPSPANIANGVRWNTAFAYLDAVRERSNLTIVGNATCDRLEIKSGRVSAIVVAGRDGPVRVEAGRVVVAAGTYGSPAILARSGIGDPRELRAAGITATHDLPGVGRNLHDHPLSFNQVHRDARARRDDGRVCARSLDARGADDRQGAILAMYRGVRSAHLSRRWTRSPQLQWVGDGRSKWRA